MTIVNNNQYTQPMETKASFIVMSHLSDAQEQSAMGLKLSVQSHVNFAKYVISECNGDLNKLIDADLMWTKFMKTPYYIG